VSALSASAAVAIDKDARQPCANLRFRLSVAQFTARQFVHPAVPDIMHERDGVHGIGR